MFENVFNKKQKGKKELVRFDINSLKFRSFSEIEEVKKFEDPLTLELTLGEKIGLYELEYTKLIETLSSLKLLVTDLDFETSNIVKSLYSLDSICFLYKHKYTYYNSKELLFNNEEKEALKKLLNIETQDFMKYITSLNEDLLNTKKLLDLYIKSFLLEQNVFNMKKNIEKITMLYFKDNVLKDINIFYSNNMYKYDLLLLNNNKIFIVNYLYVTSDSTYESLRKNLMNENIEYIPISHLDKSIKLCEEYRDVLNEIIVNELGKDVEFENIIISNKSFVTDQYKIYDIQSFKDFLSSLEVGSARKDLSDFINEIQTSGDVFITKLYADTIAELANNYVYYLTRVSSLIKANKVIERSLL